MAFKDQRERVAWALEAAERLLPDNVSSTSTPLADIWILAHGFSNAFSSVAESLEKIDKQREPRAHALVSAWLRSGARALIDDYNNRFRNALTHQGKFELRSVSIWTDADDDEQYVIYQTSYGRPGETLRKYTFREWTIFCLSWLAGELDQLTAQHDYDDFTPTTEDWS